MEASSQLERFLLKKQAEGSSQGESTFTISRREAVRKLGQSSFPFEGAWMLKLIQSGVAFGAGGAIRVQLKSLETLVSFDPGPLDLDTLESEFYDPRGKETRALDHLFSALWNLAISLKRPFKISLENQVDCLIWDGEELYRVPDDEPGSGLSLTIRYKAPSDSSSFAARAMEAARTNISLQSVLETYCYTCSVPLILDGRRLDTLLHCPTHGVTRESAPLALGFPPSLMPELALPPGTFENLEKGSSWSLGALADRSGLRSYAHELGAGLKPSRSAGLAYILSSHWWVNHLHSTSFRPESRRKEHPTIYWVQDGVVVQKERIWNGSSHCSLAIFVNAEGLRTDLTTIRLARTEERDRRRLAAVRAVREHLEQSQDMELAIARMTKNSRRSSTALGILSLTVGVVASASVLPLSVVSVAAGAMNAYKSKALVEDLKENFRKEIASLKRMLRSAENPGLEVPQW